MADEHNIPELIPGLEELNMSTDNNTRNSEPRQQVQQPSSSTINEPPEDTNDDQARHSNGTTPSQLYDDASDEATGVEATNQDSAANSRPTRGRPRTRAASPPINNDISAGILRPCAVCARSQLSAAQCTYYRTGQPPCGPCARRRLSAGHCQFGSASDSLGVGRGDGAGSSMVVTGRGAGRGGVVVGHEAEIGVAFNVRNGAMMMFHREVYHFGRGI